jgi:nucleoside-diphosphate-sugar epimerase
MKVFVTGVTGLIGSAIARQLVKANHTVLGLARTDAAATKLSALGITPVLGDLSDLSLLASTAKQVDAVIHCGFDHAAAFSGKALEACDKDRAAITALCDALVESKLGATDVKVFLNSMGLLGNVGSDEFSAKHPNPHMPRHLSELLVKSYVDKGIKAINIRLSPVTHGSPIPHPFIAGIVSAAKQNSKAKYVGDGSSVWATCDAEDAAALYILALTADIPKDACLNAAAVEYTTKEIVEHVAGKLNVETGSMTKEEAMGLGFIGMVLSHGGPTSTELTKKWTGWEPKGQPFWEHVDATYF